MNQTRWEIGPEEAKQLCIEIAQHIDAIAAGVRQTAIVEAQRDDEPPHLAFIVTMDPVLMRVLVNLAKRYLQRIDAGPVESSSTPVAGGTNGEDQHR